MSDRQPTPTACMASGRLRSLRHRALILAWGVSWVACSGPLKQFPLREPVWHDPDQQLVADEPEEYFSPLGWDGADQTIFYPLTRFFAVTPAGEALNVNALDEVPNSSWFENRIGLRAMTPAEVALGPCSPVGPFVPQPWTVISAKQGGANLGFQIKDAAGQRHLIKLDKINQSPRATSADVLVSKLYHAAGYHVPCNRIVFFAPDTLTIAPDAMSEHRTGDEVPLTMPHLTRILAEAAREPDGRYRACASQYLEGKPLGPFTYQGVRDDDPNDVIPHEHRRELRGMRLLAAWTHHFDSREQNTLAMWLQASDSGGYVRHHLVDFGDSFGSVWKPAPMGRRIGHSYYFDVGHILEDWLLLGAKRRPWDVARFGASGRVFGYFDVQRFEPEAWRPGYPNPAFSRMSERDGAWMARILAQFTPEHLRQLLPEAHLSDAFLEQELLRMLTGRLRKTLERYLRVLSPLSHPELREHKEGVRVCVRDLMLSTGLRSQQTRRYHVSVYFGEPWQPSSLDEVRFLLDHRVCVPLPRQAGATARAPKYLILDWVVQSAFLPPQFPARLHFYDLGPAGMRLVGFERPASFAGPVP